MPEKASEWSHDLHVPITQPQQLPTFPLLLHLYLPPPFFWSILKKILGIRTIHPNIGQYASVLDKNFKTMTVMPYHT